MLPRERRFGRCGRFAKKLFEDFSFTVRTHHPPLKPLCALALPFIKTRPLVPKKFENPKKPHIAPSQRLVAKVHPSQTSLSKGPLFFPTLKKKVRIHCLGLCATLLEHPPPLHPRLPLPAAAKVARRAESPVAYPEQQSQDKRLPHLISLLLLSHRASPPSLPLSRVSFWIYQHPATLISSKTIHRVETSADVSLCRKS
jgi:hypothetical protein